MTKSSSKRTIPALEVKQWLRGWDEVDFTANSHRRKPEPKFYIFSIPAIELRSLCGIRRRQSSGLIPRAEDLGIQRQHDEERSAEISRFVQFGYPWSTLSERKRKSAEFDDLRKPGWLPTSIVVNVIRKEDSRRGSKVDDADLINIVQRGGSPHVQLPYTNWSESWSPKSVPPFEVIDGQHRLFAFDGSEKDFELPVVAFFGLDVSWQAYLFWTINIKPKKINPSLAFDLYPLLRGEDWLDRAEGHPVYRETRAQELTEALWSHPDSPWYDRINMLGERRVGGVTQSAWIKSLLASFIRSWRGKGKKAGGLFGGRLSDNDEVLGWSRAQQAAFLIQAWEELRLSIKNTNAGWAKKLRSGKGIVEDKKQDLAFSGPHTLLGTDQGVRGFLQIVNDIFYSRAPQLELRTWVADEGAAAADEKAVSQALAKLKKHKAAEMLEEIGKRLASFDWRSSSAPNLTQDERRSKLVFRGSSGYKELRSQLLEHLAGKSDDIGQIAKSALESEQ